MTLLSVERMVLESIGKKQKTISDLAQDTGLREVLLAQLLSRLVMKGLLLYVQGRYELNLQDRENWGPQISSKSQLSSEVLDLVQSLINHHFQSEEGSVFRLRKVCLSSEDEKILNALIYNVEAFIKNIEQDHLKAKTQGKTKEKKVVLWGHCNYGDLIQESLRAV